MTIEWKGICFDLDNTLFSHEKAFKDAIRDSFYTYLKNERIPVENISFDDFFHLFKHNSDRYWELFEKKNLSGTEYRRKRFNETMKEIELPFGDIKADQFHAHYYEVVDNYSVPYPGLKELFSLLHKENIKLGIITNGMVDTQFGKVEKIGADKWIPRDRIIISEEVGYVKPQQEIYQMMEGNLQISNKELLFIGDSWQHDVAGAIGAGWDAIFLNTRKEARKTEHEPVVELHTLKEVLNYFKKLII